MSDLLLQSNVTQVLKVLLTAHGETQADVAEVLGVTQSSVSNKMAGKTRWSLDDIQRLTHHFELTSPSVFLEDARRLLIGGGVNMKKDSA